MSNTINYEKLSQQEPLVNDIKSNFSLSLSSDGSQDSLDIVFLNLENKPRRKRKLRKKDRPIRMMLDGFDNAAESYEVCS